MKMQGIVIYLHLDKGALMIKTNNKRLKSSLVFLVLSLSTFSAQSFEGKEAAFNRGLLQYYSYDNEAALRDFQEAVRFEPHCAMCHWGIAVSLIIPYITDAKFYKETDRIALGLHHAQLANNLSKHNTRENDYAKAVLKFYESAQSDILTRKKNYAISMQQLMEKYPEDIDAAVLTAGAWMSVGQFEIAPSSKLGCLCQSYHAFWDENGKPKKYTLKIIDILQTSLRKSPLHTGANHYLIHAIEASSKPELALNNAKVLEANDYSIGHYAHMPSHIYRHIGEYDLAIKANTHAVELDEAHLKTIGVRGTNYEAFYTHDLTFLINALAMAGQGTKALEVANKLTTFIQDKSFIQYPILTQDAFDYMLAIPLMVLTRFEQWQDILKIPKPATQHVYTISMWHYARGLAFASLGNIEQANKESFQLQFSSDNIQPGNNNLKLIQMSENHLKGKIAQVQHQTKDMMQYYQAALEIEKTLPFIEPQQWFSPLNQILGYASMKEKRYQEAEKYFNEDLKRNPKNPWSLYGLAKTHRLQGNTTQALKIENQFQMAAKGSDVEFDVLYQI